MKMLHILILVPTPSAPETNIGFSYPVGTLNIPPKPPIPGAFSLSLSTKAFPASISTPEDL